MSDVLTRVCRICSVEKPLTEFYRLARHPSGYDTHCKPCGRAKRAHMSQAKMQWRRERYAGSREQVLDGNRERVYGMTRAQYDAIFDAQFGRCALCLQPESARNQSGDVRLLAVDHDHSCCSPGKNKSTCGQCVRGLLCTRCNTALGLFNDDLETLRRAVVYLQARQPVLSGHTEGSDSTGRQ